MMASKQDPCPPGTKDKISEEEINCNVNIFRHYLEKAIMARDLVGHFELFTREQRTELLHSVKNNPTWATRQALEMIDQTSHSDKYTHLLETLDKEGYPKLVGLLTGKLFCDNDNHRKRFSEVTPLLYQQLNPSETVPYLLQKGVISSDEADEIRKIETNKSRSDAALELQYILPNRHRDWYELTIRSLVESTQRELATEIDPGLTKAILHVSDEVTGPSPCRPAISLQSLVNPGSVEQLTGTSVTEDNDPVISSRPTLQDPGENGQSGISEKRADKIGANCQDYLCDASTDFHSLFKMSDEQKTPFENLTSRERNVVNTQGTDRIQQKSEIKDKLVNLQKSRISALYDLQEKKLSCIKEIELFRQALHSKLDKLEKDLLADLDEIEKDMRHSIYRQVEILRDTLIQLDENDQTINLAETNGIMESDVKTSTNLEDCGSVYRDILKDEIIPNIVFQRNEKLQEIFKQSQAFGTVIVDKQCENEIEKADTNTLTKTAPCSGNSETEKAKDFETPLLLGCVVLPDGKALLDRFNVKTELIKSQMQWKVKDFTLLPPGSAWCVISRQ